MIRPEHRPAPHRRLRRNIPIHRLYAWAAVLAGFGPDSASAAHPLISDDTGTQGQGRLQWEVTFDAARHRQSGQEQKSDVISTVWTYGADDRTDLILTLPYQKMETYQDEGVARERGQADVAVDVKWRFFESGPLSLAIKPGVTLPVGNEANGLGTGKTGYSLYAIASTGTHPWSFHLDTGYLRNNTRLPERKHLGHASLGVTRALGGNAKIVADLGIDRNPDPAARSQPVFLLGGLIYALSNGLDLDLGVKFGLTRAEADYSLLLGMTKRF